MSSNGDFNKLNKISVELLITWQIKTAKINTKLVKWLVDDEADFNNYPFHWSFCLLIMIISN